MHARLANVRVEYVKSVVDRVVKTKPQFIAIEALNVKGMVKNRHLSKAAAGQNFYTFKLRLLNKCKEYEIVVKTFYKQRNIRF